VFAIGSSLRETRVRQGLELAEAEAATKIRAKYLRALEDERFEVLPSQAYVKGFVRTYADYLGLDGQLYVDEFNSRFASGDDDLPALARPRRPRGRSGREVESTVVLVALAGIAAVTALVVVAWKWGGGNQAERPTLVGPPAATAPAQPPAAAEWARVEIMAVRGDSWLRVTQLLGRGREKRLFNGFVRRGDERSFVGPRLVLLVGQPRNLEVRLAGKPVRLDPSRHTFTATPRSLRPSRS
jgi:cytoskeletal protein RodZ